MFPGPGKANQKHYTVRKVPSFAGDGCDMVAFVERHKALSLTMLLPVFWLVCLIGARLCAVIIFQIHEPQNSHSQSSIQSQMQIHHNLKRW